MTQFTKNLQPTPGDVHVNAPLTNVSVAFTQDAEGFVADKVFPTVPVAKQSDLYWEIDRAFFNRSEMRKRAPGTESAGIGMEQTTNPYFCHVYALHHDIEDERRANADTPFGQDRTATELLMLQGLLHREKEWAAKYFALSIWTTDVTGVSGAPGANQVKQWNDAASTPIEDIRAARTAVKLLTGMRPNTLVLGAEVVDSLYDHPDVIDRVKYGQMPGSPADINLSDLALLFKVPRIFVMDAIENTAKEGAAESNAFIGGKSALLCYVAASAGLETPTAGYTFSWTGFVGAANMGQRITKIRAPLIKSDRIEIEMAFDQKLISADLGYFFETIVA